MASSKKIMALYLVAFFLNLHIALPTYVNSTFLSNFVPERFVGLIYTIASLFAIWAFIYLPDLLSKFGNYKVGMTTLIAEIIAIFSLAITQNPFFIIPIFMTSLILVRIVSFNADIFLEAYSDDSETGGIRGFFLTATNMAWVISPLIAGIILEEDNFSRLYTIASLVALPVFFIFLNKFNKFKDPKYDHPPFWQTLKEVFRKDGVKKIFMANVMLRFFYSWMVIYTPIYLHEHIGFPWDEIGLIFTIMLVPFVLLEIPLGKIADCCTGEKELLSLGFVILAISTAYLSFIESTSFVFWAIALLITRIGASMTEIMSETYFFKKIDGTDSNIIGFFRMTAPVAYILGPALATLLLVFLDIRYLFLVLGIIMLWGLRYSLTLKDTK